jgi:sterol desaturase/sphingolipid hydroxylase (fatty acid hydroxylase superfamily)
LLSLFFNILDYLSSGDFRKVFFDNIGKHRSSNLLDWIVFVLFIFVFRDQIEHRISFIRRAPMIPLKGQPMYLRLVDMVVVVVVAVVVVVVVVAMIWWMVRPTVFLEVEVGTSKER